MSLLIGSGSTPIIMLHLPTTSDITKVLNDFDQGTVPFAPLEQFIGGFPCFQWQVPSIVMETTHDERRKVSYSHLLVYTYMYMYMHVYFLDLICFSLPVSLPL